METIEIVMEVEDHFGISIPDDVASNCIIVDDLHKVIVELLVQKGQPRSDELVNKVWADLVTLVSKVLGIRPHLITPTSRWVGDLTAG